MYILWKCKGSVNENRKPNPQGYYGYTKFKGEELIKKLSLKYKFKYGILRYFNVAGASNSGKIGEIRNITRSFNKKFSN